MFDVFISYKSEERAEAHHIKNILQANGLSCWMDQDQIEVGQDYEKEIAKVMPKCRAFILLLSYASQMSKEVKVEYCLAKRNELKIFPIKIEECGLSGYYDAELKHTQIALEYWKSEANKQKVLSCIRDRVYEIKGEQIKTADDFLNMRIHHYQSQIQENYDKLMENWSSIIQKSVERCGFMTPQPHYIRGVITEALHQYFDLVNIYIEDIVTNSTEDVRLKDFLSFIIERDMISKAWLPFEAFIEVALKELTYLSGDRSDDENVFLLRVYKDYIIALDSDVLCHPVVKLCDRLYRSDMIRYEMFMAQIQFHYPGSFVDKASLGVFINPRYIGAEYVNISSLTYIDDRRSVFLPEDITQPTWIDFVRRFKCDVFMQESEKLSGAAALTTFFVENSFFTNEENFNYMYYYLMHQWIERGSLENVKILLRNLGTVNWNRYVTNTNDEIRTLKRFYYCCMWENGYEDDLIKNLWREA